MNAVLPFHEAPRGEKGGWEEGEDGWDRRLKISEKGGGRKGGDA